MPASCNTDRIKLVKKTENSMRSLAVFEGYGYKMMIMNIKDGGEPAISVSPLDDSNHVRVFIPDESSDFKAGCLIVDWEFPREDLDRVKTALDDAAAFCDEFMRRRTELCAMAGYSQPGNV